jgi:hypothetical protein
MLKPIFWILAIVLAIAPSAYAQRVSLDIDGKVDAIASADFNGDGIEDLVLQFNRELRIFDSGTNGVSTAPSRTLTLPWKAWLWCIEPATKAHHARIWIQGEQGAEIVHPETSGETPQCAGKTLFVGSCSGKPLAKPFLMDVNQDELLDVIVFESAGLQVWRGVADGTKSKLGSPLNIKTDHRLKASDQGISHQSARPVQRRIEERIRVPLFGFSDLTGNGHPDLWVFQNRHITIQEQNPDGSFAGPRPPVLLSEKRSKSRERFFSYELPPLLADLNGDGVTDIVSIYPGRGKAYVYRNRKDLVAERTPDQTRAVDGWLTHYWLEDINGDGRKDLILSAVEKFGVVGGLRILVNKEVELQLLVYLTGEDGLPAKQADYRKTITVPFSVSLSRTNASLTLPFDPFFGADLTADGSNDLLVKTDAETLGIFAGSAETVFTEEPVRTISLNNHAEFEYTVPSVADLNGDGKQDLVLHHVDWDAGKQAVEVIYSP